MSDKKFEEILRLQHRNMKLSKDFEGIEMLVKLLLATKFCSI